MISFLHGADFHLDSPFSSLPPEQAAERRAEQRTLFSSLALLAEGVDLVLLAGDLFDGARVYPETVECIRQTLGQINAPVFIAPGNHDPLFRSSPYHQVKWPPNVHIFDAEAITSVSLPELQCVIYGAGFSASSCHRSLLNGFCAPEDDWRHLMVLHGEVCTGEGAYNPITPAEIAQSGLDYLALGHIHQGSGGCCMEGRTAYAWPGCPQGRGFDETGEKGVFRGRIEETGVILDFIPMAKHRYWEQTVSLAGDVPPLEEVLSALPPETEQDIYRITLTGESGPEGLNLEALYQALDARFYHLTLRDHTVIRQDLWARAGEDTLTGLFLKEMQRRLRAARTEQEQQQVQKAVRFGLAALEGREDPMGWGAGSKGR